MAPRGYGVSFHIFFDPLVHSRSCPAASIFPALEVARYHFYSWVTGLLLADLNHRPCNEMKELTIMLFRQTPSTTYYLCY